MHNPAKISLWMELENLAEEKEENQVNCCHALVVVPRRNQQDISTSWKQYSVPLKECCSSLGPIIHGG